MKKLKDIEYTEAKIKISRVRERYKDKECTTFKDKLICIDIDLGYVKISTCFPDNKSGRKNLLKMIKEEIYL